MRSTFTLLIIFIFFFPGSIVFGQGESTKVITPRMLDDFKRDAAVLTLRQAEDKTALTNMPVAINGKVKKKYLNALRAVHISGGEELRKLSIHTCSDIKVDVIEVKCKNVERWKFLLGKNLADEKIDAQLKAFCLKHKLELGKGFRDDEDNLGFTLLSKEKVNMMAIGALLSKEINELTPVVKSTRECSTEAKNVEGQIGEDNKIKLTYSYHWNDYKAQSEKTHVWVYEVSQTGQVVLLSEKGDRLPKRD